MRRRRVEEPDRTLELPEEILGTLVSFLPSSIDVAVTATTVLARHWRNAWRHSSVLRFSSNGRSLESFQDMVNRFLEGPRGDLVVQHIVIEMGGIGHALDLLRPSLDRWLRLVNHHRVPELSLSDTGILALGGAFHQMPWLTTLTLTNFRLNMPLILHRDRLTHLRLHDCIFRDTDDLERIIRNTDLVDIDLRNCTLLHSLFVYSDTLTNFSLNGAPSLAILVIITRNLEELTIVGPLNLDHIRLMPLPAGVRGFLNFVLPSATDWRRRSIASALSRQFQGLENCELGPEVKRWE